MQGASSASHPWQSQVQACLEPWLQNVLDCSSLGADSPLSQYSLATESASEFDEFAHFLYVYSFMDDETRSKLVRKGNGDGVLDVNEFQRCLENIGLQLGSRTPKKIVQVWHGMV